jgi:hypothetical protein
MGILPMRNNPARHGQDAHATEHFRQFHFSFWVYRSGLMVAKAAPAKSLQIKTGMGPELYHSSIRETIC